MFMCVLVPCCLCFFSSLHGVCICVRNKHKKLYVCGPASVLLQHREKRKMALSGASFNIAYHSITDHAA